MKKLLFSLVAVVAVLVCAGCGTKSKESKVELMAMLANAQCPVVVDEATTLVKVDYENDEFVYYYHIQDETLSILSLLGKDECEELLKEQTKSGLNPALDENVAELLDVLIDVDATLVYSYCDFNDKEHFRVVLTPEELTEL